MSESVKYGRSVFRRATDTHKKAEGAEITRLTRKWTGSEGKSRQTDLSADIGTDFGRQRIGDVKLMGMMWKVYA